MVATYEDMVTAFRETDEEVAKRLEENEETAFLAPLYRLCSEKRIALLDICYREIELETDLSEETWLTKFRYKVKMQELLKQLTEEQIETAYKIYNGEMYAYGMGIAGYSDDYLDELDALLGEE